MGHCIVRAYDNSECTGSTLTSSNVFLGLLESTHCCDGLGPDKMQARFGVDAQMMVEICLWVLLSMIALWSNVLYLWMVILMANENLE